MNKEYEVVCNPSSEEWNVASELTEKNKDLKSRKLLCLQKPPSKIHFLQSSTNSRVSRTGQPQSVLYARRLAFFEPQNTFHSSLFLMYRNYQHSRVQLNTGKE